MESKRLSIPLACTSVMLAALALVPAAALAQTGTPNAVVPITQPAPRPSALANEPIAPLPRTIAHDPAKAALGRELFADKRLSEDQKLSCLSCHFAARAGADGLAFSPGVGGKLREVNTPTVYNSGLNYRLTWSGRMGSLEELAEALMERADTMGSNWEVVLARLRADPALVARFNAVFPGAGITRKTVSSALAEFQRTLTTPNARFDQYLNGKPEAISAEERRGYALFKSYGCAACHQGANVGGNMVQRFGAMGDYFKDRAAAGRPLTTADNGLFNTTKREEDRHVFKVPSLRNVALTAPYFHDASAQTLEEAVEVMFKYQLGRQAPAADKAAIIKFLGTLTGEAPESLKDPR